jgi:hypothetical protein
VRSARASHRRRISARAAARSRVTLPALRAAACADRRRQRRRVRARSTRCAASWWC